MFHKNTLGKEGMQEGLGDESEGNSPIFLMGFQPIPYVRR